MKNIILFCLCKIIISYLAFFHVYYWYVITWFFSCNLEKISTWNFFQRLQIVLALRARAILLVFEKFYSCLFIPNCARNHVITYTNKILPTDRFHLVTDTNQNLEFMKLNPFAGKQSKDIDSWKKKILFCLNTIEEVPIHFLRDIQLRFNMEAENEWNWSQLQILPSVKEIHNF